MTHKTLGLIMLIIFFSVVIIFAGHYIGFIDALLTLLAGVFVYLWLYIAVKFMT